LGELKLRKHAFKHVEAELFSYHETRKEIIRMKNEILYCSQSRDENVGGSRSGTTSDPTGRTATLLVSHKQLDHLQSITDAIESVYNRLPEDKKRLVNLYYWTKPQPLTWEGVAQKLNCNRATAFRWRDEIVWAISQKLGWR
jgi:RinA family phage transcriptional activator